MGKKPNKVQPKFTVATAEKRLATFRQHNRHSSISEEDTPLGRRIVVKRPWNDETIALEILSLADPLVDILNEVYLPEQFTGLWHRDTKDFEIIWTAFPLSGPRADIKGRSFSYQHDKRAYKCEFSRSSDRLLAIARAALPIAPQTETGFRNLFSFGMYARRDSTAMPGAEPMSFWVRGVEWDDDKVLSLALHLSFYLSYYDTKSPRIVINALKSDMQSSQPQTRYAIGKFPKNISGKPLDDALLMFWDAAHGGDSGRRFTYCYRILEYVCHTYLEVSVRNEMRKILSKPHVLDIIDKATEDAVGALQKYLSNTKDFMRIEAFLRETLDPALLWREVNANIGSFNKDVTFTGGEVVKAFPQHVLSAEGFANSGIKEFISRAKDIRNALSHGKESRQPTFIAPTAANYARLGPWVTLMMVVAGAAILHSKTL